MDLRIIHWTSEVQCSTFPSSNSPCRCNSAIGFHPIAPPPQKRYDVGFHHHAPRTEYVYVNFRMIAVAAVNLKGVFDRTFAGISEVRQSFTPQLTAREVGVIASISTGIARVSGILELPSSLAGMNRYAKHLELSDAKDPKRKAALAKQD
jgi:hypothetical protein